MNDCFCNKMKCGIIPAFLIHLCVGSVYCWPLLDEYIGSTIGKFYSGLGFSIAIFFIGLAALFSRMIVNKLGFRTTILLSTVLFGSGIIISGISLINSLPWLFVFSYGVISGLGIGLGYMSPIKNLMLWFNKNIGLVVGISIFGFGLSKFICTPVFESTIISHGVGSTMIYFGIISSLIMFIGFLLIHRPPGWFPKINTFKEFFEFITKLWDNKDYRRYWLIFFITSTVGISLMYSERMLFSISTVFGSSIGITTGMMLSAVFNTTGRLFFPTISDYLKDRNKLLTFMTIAFMISCLIGYIDYQLIPISIFISFAIYGGIFALMPCILADMYGIENVSTSHGYLLISWGVAGFTGPLLSSITDSLGISGLMLVYFILLLISLYNCIRIGNK